MLAPLMIVTLLPLQGPQDAPRSKPQAVEAAFRDWTDQEARAAVADFKRTFRRRKASLRDRVGAVEALARGRHRLLVKPLVQIVRKGESVTVRRKAAEALGHQPPKRARPYLLKLVEDGEVRDEPAVLAAVITSLSSAGYRPRDWDDLEDLFERDFAREYVPVQKALLQLVIDNREKQAWKLLLRHLDEPAPVWVDSPTNPPASYWEKRWKAWRLWRADVKEALFKITGQRFGSAEEARTWIEHNGAKIGLK